MTKDKKLVVEQRKKVREDKTAAQDKIVSDRIRGLMKEAKITNKQLAAVCHRDEADISRWLKKEPLHSIPVWELSLISDYLDEQTEQGCCIEYLIGHSNARHFEYDSLVKKTGLSDDAIKALIDWKNNNSTDSLNDLFVNGRKFLVEYQIYYIHEQAVRLKTNKHITEQVGALLDIGKRIFEYTMTQNIKDKMLFDVYKEQLNIYGVSVNDKTAAFMFNYCLDIYQSEIHQQKCLKELTLFLESLK